MTEAAAPRPWIKSYADGVPDDIELPTGSLADLIQSSVTEFGDHAADRIRERVRFYDWDRALGQVRWMCAFDTTEADVDAFVAVIREELARS